MNIEKIYPVRNTHSVLNNKEITSNRSLIVIGSQSIISNGVKKLSIPKSPGVYRFKDKRGKIIYIGKAADLRSRVLSYLPAMRVQARQAGWKKSTGHSPAKFSMLKQIEKIEWQETDSEIEALLLEANLIKKYQPQYNIVMRDDKRYIYIKVSLDDEIPGVYATRKIDKSGKYFGPFTSAEAVRETLKAIRKIWPFCLNRRAGKFCFYYQIGRCAGVCGGAVTRKEYLKKIIKPIILFLEGKKRVVIRNLKLVIGNLEKELKKYKAGGELYNEKLSELENLKYQLKNINRVLAHANVLGVGEKYANDVVELAKVLGLPKLPARIEGYDISNIFGQSATGSMVVFSGGEPNKNEYRKFKIRVGPSSAEASAGKQGDVQMLREILERRFKHSIENKSEISDSQFQINPPTPLSKGGDLWPLPDLIIVDGGKGQLNAVLSVLKKFKLNIQVIAISKGDGLRSALARDKIFFPKEKNALLLPLASPALHLLKRVRDEAHRFTVSYHKKLRGKRFLNIPLTKGD